MTVKVSTGSVLIVRLASNATTGYQWRGGKPDSACLKPVGKPTYEPPNTQMPGAGGTQVFAYSAVKPGRARLSFEYVRPWEKKPVKTYSVSVVIDVGNDPVLLHDGLKNVEYVSEFVRSGKVCLVEDIYSENATPRSPCRI
jgi:predicted secreted protein